MNPMKPSQPIASICLTEWKDESDVPFLYDTTNEDATWKQRGTTSVTWLRKRRYPCVNGPLKFAGRREERCKHELIEDSASGSQNPTGSSPRHGPWRGFRIRERVNFRRLSTRLSWDLRDIVDHWASLTFLNYLTEHPRLLTVHYLFHFRTGTRKSRLHLS